MPHSKVHTVMIPFFYGRLFFQFLDDNFWWFLCLSVFFRSLYFNAKSFETLTYDLVFEMNNNSLEWTVLYALNVQLNACECVRVFLI